MRNTTLLLAAAGLLAAAEPAGFVHWRAAELKGYAQKLAPKMDAQKLAIEQLGSFGNHSFLIAHREAAGEAEWHEWMADVFVVQGGRAELVVGGEIPDARDTAPGEKRGARIAGGRTVPLAAGDIVHIPAKTAHQVIAAAGQPFTYFVVKVDVRR
jgi:mannose-6-phosphate isomerase-like protein (cupin superfamily)